MTNIISFDAMVSSIPEPHMLDRCRGVIFWVHTSRDAWTEDVQVFLPVSRAELVDEVDLSIGAKLRIENEQLDTGIVGITTDNVVGNAAFPLPCLLRLDGGR